MAQKTVKKSKSVAKQRKARNKQMNKWVVRVAIVLLILVFLAFMIVPLFSSPKIV